MYDMEFTVRDVLRGFIFIGTGIALQSGVILKLIEPLEPAPQALNEIELQLIEMRLPCAIGVVVIVVLPVIHAPDVD